MRVLIDTNIVLDVLLNREKHVRDSAIIISKVQEGILEGYLAAHTIATLYYFGRKHIGPDAAKRFLVELIKIFRIARVDEYVIEQSLSLSLPDFEDAVVCASADASDTVAVITRDKDGFKRATMPVFSPSEMLGILAAAQ